jgi:phospholipid/cholesterol/gamma-HCH transport system substrate-binding protein
VGLAVLLAWFLLFRQGGGYEVKLRLSNASQLVTGDQVKVGGIPVGDIRDITLAPDGEALLTVGIDDGRFTPLHRDSRVEVRSTSLSGVANRYLSLTPGPNNFPTIPDGGEIPASDATAEVDLDEVLNALDPQTQRDLRTAVRLGGRGFAGPAGRQLGSAIEALNPGLSQTDATEREVLRDQPALERFILESADVVGAVASRPDDLHGLVGNARGTLEALASRDTQLDATLRKLPPTLRAANTTLVNLRGAVSDVRPTIRSLQPAAPLIAKFLVRPLPITSQNLPVIKQLRRNIDGPGNGDLIGVLEQLPALQRKAVPALHSGTKTVADLQPLLPEVRAYVPDVVAGILNGYAGTASGPYDANGHYTRISFQSSVYSPPNLLSLVPRPPSQQGLTGYRTGIFKRCPGAATQPAPDGSNPFIPLPGICSAEESPR